MSNKCLKILYIKIIISASISSHVYHPMDVMSK